MFWLFLGWNFTIWTVLMDTLWGGGGRGCAACFPEPHPTYGQNLQFSPPYLLPDQIFDTLFMTIAAGTAALKVINEGL